MGLKEKAIQAAPALLMGLKEKAIQAAPALLMGLKEKAVQAAPALLMGRAGRPGPSKQFIFPILLFPLIFIRAPYPRALTGADKCNPARRPAPDARLVRGYLSAPIFLDLRLKICFNI